MRITGFITLYVKQYFKYTLFLSFFLILGGAVFTQPMYFQKYVIETDSGKMVLALYKKTPLHAANFKKLIKTSYYKDLLFHRTIPEFVIQGGDPLSKNALKGDSLGHGDLGYTVPAEICKELFHGYGAVGMARESDPINPLRASSACQFYIVIGKIRSPKTLEDELNRISEKRFTQQWTLDSTHYDWASQTKFFKDSLKNAIYNRVKPVLSSKQLKIYTSMGGIPHLDGRYTVFGNIIWGMHVAEQISVCAKDTRDRPMGDMRFTIRKMTWAEHLKPFSKW
jgi:peptidylprolyl isomerase